VIGLPSLQAMDRAQGARIWMASEATDMRCGFDRLAERVRVVLPNRDVLLWHFKGNSVLGFHGEALDSWDYYGWRSTGATVRPDGTLSK
jgi:hypothetical protein